MTVPTTLEGIEAFAFFRTFNLKKVDLLNTNLKKVGYYAFQESGIEEITFPHTLEEMGKYALSMTPNLKEVDLLNTNLYDLAEGMFWKSGIRRLRFPRFLEDVMPYVLNESSIQYLDMANCERKIIEHTDLKWGERYGGYMTFVKEHNIKTISPGEQSECTYIWPADEKEKEKEKEQVTETVKKPSEQKTYRIAKKPSNDKKQDDYAPGD